MALDLSAKTFGDSSKPPSPVPCSSPGSDTSTYDKLTASALSGLHVDRLLNQATRHPQQTVDGFPEAGFALAGGVRPAPTTAAGHLLLQAKAERLSPLSPDGPRDVGRPFRNYPIEAMSTMYSQMAASAASMSAAGMYSQYGGAASSPAFIDNFLSSPIAQYLQQKKRRSDCRGKGSGGGNGGVGGIDVAALPLAPSVDVSLAGDDAYYSQLPNVSMSSPGDRSSGDNRSPLGDLDHDTPGKRQRTSIDSFCGVANMSIEERRDESYWERRRKNNEAAKRSRDARRQKEEEIALRAAFLEQENLKLHAQVTILKNETAKLHYMLYNRM